MFIVKCEIKSSRICCLQKWWPLLKLNCPWMWPCRWLTLNWVLFTGTNHLIRSFLLIQVVYLLVVWPRIISCYKYHRRYLNINYCMRPGPGPETWPGPGCDQVYSGHSGHSGYQVRAQSYLVLFVIYRIIYTQNKYFWSWFDLRPVNMWLLGGDLGCWSNNQAWCH